MATEAVLETLRQLWLILEQHNVPASVIGGLALATWKHPRTTYDVDVLIIAEGSQFQTVTSRLAQIGFKRTSDKPLDLGDMSLVQYTFEPADIFVTVQTDLLLAKSDFARQAIGRSVKLTADVLGFEVQVLGCEDLIVFKLLAGRVIDRADACALLTNNSSTIDFDLLNRLASEAHVEPDLKQLQRDMQHD